MNDSLPHITEDDLILHHYGEKPATPGLGAAELEEALHRDPALAARLEEIREVLAAVDRGQAAELPGGQDDVAFGAATWRRLEERLPAATSAAWSRKDASSGASGSAKPAPAGLLRRHRAWLQAAAAVLLLAVGYLAGRSEQPAPAAPEQATFTLSAAGRERILRASLSSHLGEAERLITEISNQPFDAASEQAWAAELLRANRLHRQAAQQAGQHRIAALLGELEPIFLELAHDGQAEAEEVAGVRERIAGRDLLLKLRLTERSLAGPRSDV